MANRGNATGVLVLGAIAALAAGGIAAWLLWWKPRQEREDARAQIAAWEQRWAAVRTCLLGDPPLAADPADALALAELASGQVTAASSGCLEQVKTLTRPEGAASPVAAVEAAWMEVEAAIPAVAQAYAMRYSARDDEIDRRVADLGVAITALDAAQDRLRAAAGVAAAARTGTHTLARLPAPVPVVVDGAAVTVGAAGVARAGALTWADDLDGDRPAIRVTSAPTAGFAARWPGDAALAQPDRSWMAWVSASTPAGDATGADAAAPGPSRLHAAPTAPAAPDAAPVIAEIGPGQELELVAALGAGADRLILALRYDDTGEPTEDVVDDEGDDDGASFYGEELELAGTLVAWASRDGGATWQPTPPPLGDGAPAAAAITGYAVFPDWLAGTLDVVLGTAAGDLLVQLDGARPTAPAVARPIPDGDLADGCRRGGVTWWLAGQTVYRAAAGTITERPLAVPDDAARLADCTATAALIEQASAPVVYHRCVEAGCSQAFRGGSYAFGRAAMLPDGGVVYVAGRGHVLALWRDAATAPSYLALPRALSLHDVVVWGDAAHALVHEPRDPDRALLAVPLPPR